MESHLSATRTYLPFPPRQCGGTSCLRQLNSLAKVSLIELTFMSKTWYQGVILRGGETCLIWRLVYDQSLISKSRLPKNMPP